MNKTPEELFKEWTVILNQTNCPNEISRDRANYLAGFKACESQEKSKCCEACRYYVKYNNTSGDCNYRYQNQLAVNSNEFCSRWKPKDEV